MASAKEKKVWFCTSCGNESPKWMGRCPACGEWNTMVEQTVATGRQPSSRTVQGDQGRRPVHLKEIDSSSEARISVGLGEVDRLLGGGIVRGSLVLIGDRKSVV